MAMETKKEQNLLGYAILGISLIVAVSIFSFVFYKVRFLENTITVVGSAKEKVTSDTVKWTGILQVEAPKANLSEGYKKINENLESVKKFFKENGISEEKLIIKAPVVETPWCGNSPCETVIVKQEVVLNLNEIEKVQKLEEKSRELVLAGVNFTTLSLEYFYSALPELRVKLLKEAMKDAKKRAESILEISGKKLGSLKSVSVGVVQVLAPNSVEISDWGTYDTSTIEKEVTVTVRATYLLK